MKTEMTSCFRQGWARLRARKSNATASVRSEMATAALACAVALVPMLAAAEGSVVIGSYSFHCQNMCVVSQGAGGMHVSDSGGGWVRIFSAHGRLPVPN